VTISTPVNLVRVACLSQGTGAFALGPALPAFRGMEALVDGETYSYSVQQGSNFEAGRGVYSSGTGTLTRGVVTSSYGNGPVAFGPGAVVVFPALAEDLQVPGPPGPPGDPGDPGPSGGPGANGAGINMPVSSITGAFTPSPLDANTYKRFTGAAVFTVPLDSTSAVPIASVIAVEQTGAGVVTFTPEVGVTLNSRDGATATAGQWAVAQVKKVGANEWTLLGDVA